MDVEREMRERAQRITAMLDGYLPKEEGYAKTVLSAMNYSVRAGGKRLRPILMEESFKLFGGKTAYVEPFMAAIECIHTYSLVHDDLPAMDDDEYRRGKKTTHTVYGEAMAILAGDGLLNHAYEILAEAMAENMREHGVCDPKMVRAFAELSTSAGVKGMVGGQSVDVESEGVLFDDPCRGVKLAYIFECKTGALLRAALTVGAILAGADEASVAKMGEVGRNFGTAFQIQDDILDVTGDIAVLGKKTGSDEKNHKATYVTFYGLDKAKNAVSRQTEAAISILEDLDGDSRFLQELFRYLIYREM